MVKRIIAACMAVCSVFFLARAPSVSASDEVFSASWNIDREAASGSVVSAYCVGSISDDMVVWVDSCKEAFVSVDLTDVASLESGAAKMISYLNDNHVEADYSVVIESDGDARFLDLHDGLWLFTASDYVRQGTVYHAVPVFVAVVNGKPSGIDFKYEFEVPTDGTWKCTVSKRWVTDGSVAISAYINASLYRNGHLYDTVKLSPENDWTYSWDRLPVDGEYTVSEQYVPEGYIAGVTRTGDSFLITNTVDSMIKTDNQTGLDTYGTIVVAFAGLFLAVFFLAFLFMVVVSYIRFRRNRHR